MDETDLCYLDAVEAIGLFRAKRLSPAELMEAAIKRTEDVGASINASTDTCHGKASTDVQTTRTAPVSGLGDPAIVSRYGEREPDTPELMSKFA